MQFFPLGYFTLRHPMYGPIGI